jgi:DNA-binding transcriptional LysR family regulator
MTYAEGEAPQKMSQPADTTLRQLRYFATLAEELHFGKAASRLGISQPSLTRQIQSLEKMVGAALVERTQRSVSLTPAGMAFAEQARVTLQHHERSVETARNVSARRRESLAIGFECCAPYHDFPEVVRHFMSRYPRTRLSSFEMSGPEQIEALARNRIDAAFLHPPVPDDPKFVFERVGEERFVVALPSSHRLASKRRVPCSQLAEEKFALYPRSLAPGCYDAVHEICKAAGFTPKVVHESNQISVSLSLIAASGVVTLYPECVKSRPAPGVVFRDIDGSVTTVTCGFLRRSGEPAPAVDRFLKTWRAVKTRAANPRALR